MGVIRPPWIDKNWFAQCPFNYCDHFGNKEQLATICKVCKAEMKRIEKYKKRGEDPHDIKNVFTDISKQFALMSEMLKKDIERLGIDSDNLPDIEKSDINPHDVPIYQLTEKYGSRVEKVIKALGVVPTDADVSLIMMAVDALVHSRYYTLTKLYRALSSREDEALDPDDDIQDSKTSAFLAYIAIERNSRVLLALAKHKPLVDVRRKFLSLAKLSIELCDIIKTEFFPVDKLIYREFGCDEYNNNI